MVLKETLRSFGPTIVQRPTVRRLRLFNLLPASGHAGRPSQALVAAAVVPCCGVRAGVSGETLDDREIGVGLEQVADERPAQVVRIAGRDVRLLGPPFQPRHDGLRRHGPHGYASSLVDRAKQWSRGGAANGGPGIDRASRSRAGEYGALPVPLAEHDDRAGAPTIVGKSKAACFPSRGRCRRLACSLRCRSVRCARLAFGTPRSADRYLVAAAGAKPGGRCRAHGGHVLEPEFMPWDGGRVWKARERGDPVESVAHAVAAGPGGEAGEVDGGRILVRLRGRIPGEGRERTIRGRFFTLTGHCRGGMKYRAIAAVEREHSLDQGEKRAATQVNSARITFT